MVDFGHFGELLSVPESLPCSHGTEFLFDFLLLIRLMSMCFSDQPKEPRRLEGNFFVLTQQTPGDST